MTNNTDWYFWLRFLLALFSFSAATYFFIAGLYGLFAGTLVLVIYLLYAIHKHQLMVFKEINQFAEAIRYKDFSRNSDTNHPSPAISVLRTGFNEINSLFKSASKEKETQYHYLHKILEMIDTGILSYEAESGKVVWMNDSLKDMLQVPYLKLIHSFANRDALLYEQLISLQPGESKIGIVHTDKRSYKVLLSATAFQTEGKRYNLIAFQNINEALDETEAKAWQKLLSVLTHEIMNSIAPISSLADTIKNQLTAIDKSSAPDVSFADLETGIDTIKRRSEGLIRFAETYRNLNKISQPNLKRFYVRDLFEDLYNLMQPTLVQKNIELDIILKDPNLMLEADKDLIEQVLINLIVNSIDAVKDTENPSISLAGNTTNKERITLKVADNGSGIPQDVLDNIFIPFFSTKKSGSGIGLTLCKQIMMLHKGNIQVQSKLGSGSAFLLEF